MRLLGYTRVSTADQDPQLQIDALTGVGVARRDIFCDVTSGVRAAAERPGMARLLEYAEEGDTIVVWRIDRLGRSLLDVLSTVDHLTVRGVAVRSITDGIDPATSMGRFMLGLLGSLAEYERELITERVRAGVTAAQNAGIRFGRPPADPADVAAKLAIVKQARADGRTVIDAARLVGWSRATYYRHCGTRDAQAMSVPADTVSL